MKKLLILIAAFVSLSCKKNKGATGEPLPDIQLSKGINLSNWFNDYSDASQYTTRFTNATLQLIKSSGFTYVRIPIGATILYNATTPEVLNSTNLAKVDAALSTCINAGLSVMINLHPWQNNIDSLLANNTAYADKVAAYWKAVATYFKKYAADKLFFELYNEPHASAGGFTTQSFSWWPPVQQKMLTAIREVTSNHYIIAGGEGWNSINGLKQLQPYSDKKIIYNFHFYDPFLFTHQGASWAGWQPAIDARNVPYPSTPTLLAPLVAAASSNVNLRDALSWYGNQQYNIDSLDKWIKAAYDWGQLHKVKVIANEFGSYKTFAPRQSRLNCIHDTRVVFEKYKIGWAMWECDEGFGFIDYTNGNRNSPVADAAILQALGLR